jgi:NAD(P)H dehydrogenase (quinone)
MKKILVINGHPDTESYGMALSNAYKKGAAASGAEVREITVAELDFNPNLGNGYRRRTELEPDLLEAQKKISWAEHIVLIYPVWWGGVPALLKGFFDRVFLPGFAFRYRENSVWWDKLLTGRTGHIISTLDQPAWYYWLINGRPTYHSVKKMTFEFCGIKPVQTTTFGPIRNSTDIFRLDWLIKIENLGRQLK